MAILQSLPNAYDSARLAAGLFLVYCITGVVYRLFFHPLAKFPGPKLAAATQWYEFYYDCIQFGQYTFKIGRMHEKYGPIIRIGPNELHCNDPDFIGTLYAGGGARRDKSKFFCDAGGAPGSTVLTIGHDLHRLRRGPLSMFFSKASVRRLEPVVRKRIDKLTDALQSHKNSGKPVVLNSAYSAFAIDVISEYAFANCFNFLDDRTFATSMNEAFSTGRSGLHWTAHFPFLFQVLRRLPRSVAIRVNPGVVKLQDLQKELYAQVAEVIDQHERGIKPEDDSHATIFHSLLESALPDEEKALKRLGMDGFSLVRAATETGSSTMSILAFYLLSNPHVLKRLREELETVFPDPAILPSCTELESLPYLSAVIQEGLRLVYGAGHRLQRIAPNEALEYKGWTIPPGTSTGMTNYHVHNNPEIYPDPKSFSPDRWIDNPKLDRYLLAFSKGTRNCVGLNLAYEELYMSTAAVVRRLDMELFETDNSDVDFLYDNYTPKSRLDTKGVRVLVK